MKFPQIYYIRSKFWPPSFDAKFHIRDNADNLIAYLRLKAFKLKSEVRVYNDLSMTKEVLHIKARNVIGFSAAYDVSDPETGRVLGIWKRKGLQSLFKDGWEMCRPDDENMLMGRLEEDSLGMALLRRHFDKISGILFPQSYRVLASDGRLLATFKRGRNPFIPKLFVTSLEGCEGDMDKLVAAIAILMNSVENLNATSFNAKI